RREERLRHVELGRLRVLLRDDVGERLALNQRLFLRLELVLKQALHELAERDVRDRDAVVADENLEIRLHLARALVALALVLRERLHHDALELRRIAGPNLRRLRILALANQLERLELARPLEQALSGRELEEH